MKTKVYWLALIVSAVAVSQTQAHGFGGAGAHFGGASFGGAHFSGGHAAHVYHAASGRRFAPDYAGYGDRGCAGQAKENL